MRTRMVYRYVHGPARAEAARSPPASLRGHEHANRVMAAEVMREDGDLDTVCDGHRRDRGLRGAGRLGRPLRHVDSVGTHIFEEFVGRAADCPRRRVWLTPFSADDPLNTPRDLNAVNPQVVQAMPTRIASLRDRGTSRSTRRGARSRWPATAAAPPIPLGGGTGDSAGNANALASRWAEDNTDRYRPITYGSSHIQAISFLPGGRVDARTILTYGQVGEPALAAGRATRPGCSPRGAGCGSPGHPPTYAGTRARRTSSPAGDPNVGRACRDP